jgi:hypothetical protein
MKYIIFTYAGEGLPIAKHLQDEGQEVIVGVVENKSGVLTRAEKKTEEEEGALEKKRRLSLYKNLLNKMPAEELLRKMKRMKRPEDYFVFFDFNYLFRYAHLALEMGFIHGNFPTEKDRLFEVDRDEAKDFVRKYYSHINITEKYEFRSIRRAKKFLKENNGTRIWVLKGKIVEAPTVIPNTDDPELAKWQIIEALEAFKDYYEYAGFIIEERINSVVEITPEKIYYDGVPLAMTINFENKPIGSGNLSVQTGCSQDLVFPVTMEGKIHDIAFPPIVDKLAKRHKGLFFWDASLLMNRQTGEIYFGEFCPNRPGYNSFFTELSQLPSVHHFFESVVAKRNPFTLGTVGASVTLFNLSQDPAERRVLAGASIDYSEALQKDIWAYDIYKRTKNDRVRIVGYDWQLSPITGSGESIDEAVRNLYRNVERFFLANVYYRPKSDFLSMDYPTSILNRLRYGLKKGLYPLPFSVTF